MEHPKSPPFRVLYMPKKMVTAKRGNYFIHDNGGKPFLVSISPSRVNIYRVPKKIRKELENQDIWIYKPSQYTELIRTIPDVETVILGVDPQSKKNLGNSILVRKKDGCYISIGWIIYQFCPDEPIKMYFSLVGNSDVPYPMAVSDNYVYNILDKSFLPLNIISDLSLKHLSDSYFDFFMMKNKRIVTIPEVRKMKRVRILNKRI